METHKDIKLFKSSRFEDHDTFDGEYTVEVRGNKARVKPQEFFAQLRDTKSRFANLHYIGGSSGGGEPTIKRYRLRVNGQDVHFKLEEEISRDELLELAEQARSKVGVLRTLSLQSETQERRKELKKKLVQIIRT